MTQCVSPFGRSWNGRSTFVVLCVVVVFQQFPRLVVTSSCGVANSTTFLRKPCQCDLFFSSRSFTPSALTGFGLVDPEISREMFAECLHFAVVVSSMQTCWNLPPTNHYQRRIVHNRPPRRLAAVSRGCSGLACAGVGCPPPKKKNLGKNMLERGLSFQA